MVYFHPWELDPGIPFPPMPRKVRWMLTPEASVKIGVEVESDLKCHLHMRVLSQAVPQRLEDALHLRPDAIRVGRLENLCIDASDDDVRLAVVLREPVQVDEGLDDEAVGASFGDVGN